MCLVDRSSQWAIYYQRPCISQFSHGLVVSMPCNMPALWTSANRFGVSGSIVAKEVVTIHSTHSYSYPTCCPPPLALSIDYSREHEHEGKGNGVHTVSWINQSNHTCHMTHTVPALFAHQHRIVVRKHMFTGNRCSGQYWQPICPILAPCMAITVGTTWPLLGFARQYNKQNSSTLGSLQPTGLEWLGFTYVFN